MSLNIKTESEAFGAAHMLSCGEYAYIFIAVLRLDWTSSFNPELYVCPICDLPQTCCWDKITYSVSQKILSGVQASAYTCVLEKRNILKVCQF